MISENVLVRVYKFPEDELRNQLKLLGDNLIIRFDEETKRYILQTEEKIK